ncbi:hypothetical protein BpHYR1_006429 [Brachionus plicatilis]|uniref:Uncharacterized protein n=1 Tax=Brachionus plicatilis TaxID=10195 RepID=A0A3M7SYB5_BRAPC|nr:hypothetical protein BpHYR1_006429 [Brachionus plicatilis]
MRSLFEAWLAANLMLFINTLAFMARSDASVQTIGQLLAAWLSTAHVDSQLQSGSCGLRDDRRNGLVCTDEHIPEALFRI